MASKGKKRGQEFVYGLSGIPGNYSLNQKVSKFGDRRTKRERDRSSRTRNAIQRSTRDE